MPAGLEVNGNRFPLGIQDADLGDPGAKILGRLCQHVPAAIRRRKGLENQVGRNGEIAIGKYALRHPARCVESHICAPNRVGVTLDDDSGIVTDQASESSGFDILPKPVNDLCANITLARSGHEYRNELSSDQFTRPPIVRQQRRWS